MKGLGICSMFLFSLERAFVFDPVNVWPCVARYFKSNLLIVKPHWITVQTERLSPLFDGIFFGDSIRAPSPAFGRTTVN